MFLKCHWFLGVKQFEIHQKDYLEDAFWLTKLYFIFSNSNSLDCHSLLFMLSIDLAIVTLFLTDFCKRNTVYIEFISRYNLRFHQNLHYYNVEPLNHAYKKSQIQWQRTCQFNHTNIKSHPICNEYRSTTPSIKQSHCVNQSDNFVTKCGNKRTFFCVKSCSCEKLLESRRVRGHPKKPEPQKHVPGQISIDRLSCIDYSNWTSKDAWTHEKDKFLNKYSSINTFQNFTASGMGCSRDILLDVLKTWNVSG